MKRILFILVALSFSLAACGPAPTAAPPMPQGIAGGGGYDMMVAEAPMDMEMEAAAWDYDSGDDNTLRVSSSYSGDTIPQDKVETERMVIQNADLSIVVADPKEKMDEIVELAEKLDGWVVSSNQYQSYTNSGSTVPEGTITIRVPSEKLEEALEAIKKDTVDITSESRSGQDVTKEYVDLGSRLKNLEAAEDELTKIMENADTSEDVLKTFEQLTYYREQIEVVKGQMQYYEESVAMSAISVRVIAEETVEPIEVGGWKLQGTANEAAQSLINFFQGFVRFLIRLLILYIPVALIILVLVWALWLLFRFVWRKLFPRKPKPEEATEEKKEEEK